MLLTNILKGIDFKLISGSLDIEINKICYDHRKIENGDLFFALKGATVDGHDFIKEAIKKGAIAVVLSKEVQDDFHNTTLIQVEYGRKALAKASSNYYDNPSDKLKLIGITGTNGKTTSTFMIKSILESEGHKVGLVGTIANYIGNKKIDSSHTTPESLELHKLFKEMLDEGIEYCVMEVSSHSLSLDRVYGVKFKYGIFTNLTQDHLDFHKTFDAYFEAKYKLFEMSENAVINIDDPYGERIIELLQSKGNKNIVTYSIDKESDYKAFDESIHSRGVEFKVLHDMANENLYCALPGRYNIYNSLGAIIVALEEGIKLEDVKKALSKAMVPGRCEILTHNKNLGFEIIVDYAHTPDGLENILSTAREFTRGKLISVFGCGGDRDKTKRPIMGKIGCDLSDIAVITSDNPRTEEPMSIIEDILVGLKTDNYIVVENRREAIKRAIIEAQNGDVIVIAGKGHEDYQILKTGKIHFDEREVVDEILKEVF
ncbi:UDP-N-acetylmuramoyl-L-alanyl-D-glutamate--2,6-diaminopimelate ligase [Hathewaya histolytica]|uniref:UDP-N-acetylmuramoyl-L-alanyl-D-glutamate--2, 6-diaminopimelate ligase n=1 Tax=Hathewaya histolytica TaxID=1498 RepID=UPI003B6820F7